MMSQRKESKSFTCPPSLWKQLSERTRDLLISNSYVIRQLVERFLNDDIELRRADQLQGDD